MIPDKEPINPFISIVSPVYKAEKIIDELVKNITLHVSTITSNFEIILVEDCGSDNSWKKIEENCKIKKYVKGIKLSRNFGQHHAITAGINAAKGDWIVVMDCDLQDDPKEIVNLYQCAINKDADLVLASRSKRKDSFLKKMTSNIFYKIFQYLSELNIDGTIANFGIYHKKVIHAILTMNEPMRSFPSMVNWVGFKQVILEVEHQDRFEGESSYNFKKLLNLALDIIIAHSDKPLKLTIKLGLTISLLSFFIAVFYFYKFLCGAITIAGFPSLIISIWFLSGLIILILGILSLYISKIFESVKNRPLFIIDKQLNI
jgi:polyisoprenyl-phosphate glycosyltransferase